MTDSLVSLSIADVLALVGMVFSVLVFLTLANHRRVKSTSVEEMIFAGRDANAREFGASFAAASSSLATVLIFFISTSTTYGLFLLWCGFTYLVGQAIFIWYFNNRVSLETRDLTSNADFFLSQSDSLVSARVMSVLTVFTFIAILFLELYVGSEIIRYYLPFDDFTSKLIAYGSLGTIVFGYIRLGGLNVVFKTDVWQYMLMIIACICLVVFALLVPAAENGGQQLSTAVVRSSADSLQIAFFMAWILVINLTLPFTQLSSWQRLAAVETKAKAWSGFLRTIPGFIVIWGLPVIALIVLNSKGFTPGNLTELFNVLRSNGDMLALAFYSIIFVGFSSALFSTADTALVALQAAVSDRTTFYSHLSKGKSPRYVRNFYIIYTGAIILFLSILYAIAEATVGSLFVVIVFAIFGQLSIIAPQMYYALQVAAGKYARRSFGTLSTLTNLVFISIAWIITISAAISVGLGKGFDVGTQEIATVASILVSTIGLIISIHLAPKSSA